MRPTVVGLILGICLLHAPNAAAWSINTHWTVTDTLLKHLGWKNKRAIDKVVDGNIATDLIASDFSLFYPHARGEKDSVQALANTFPPNTSGTNGFHFDDLFSYNDVKKRMDDLDAWMKAQIALLIAAGWGAGAHDRYLLMLGMISHAIQDFYCHSNYANQLNGMTAGKNWNPDDFPTWDDLHGQGGWLGGHPGFPAKGALERLQESNGNPSSTEKDGKGNPKGGLQTGSWEKKKIPDPKDPTKGIKPWHHRHPGGKEGAVLIALGARATRQWIDRAIAQLDPTCRAEFLAFVNTEDSTTVTHEDPVMKDTFERGLRAVSSSYLPYSRVNIVTPAGGPAAAFTDSSGVLTDFQPEDYVYPDLAVTITLDAVDAILASANPEATAAAEVAAGRLVVTRGGAGPGCLAQSTFVDGFQGGTSCGTAPCWPGPRGDGGPAGLHDNVNSPLGDSILVSMPSGLRPGGLGVNWRIGYDATTGALDKINVSYNSALGPPRMIFRLFDPATRTWGPFDSTELYADRVAIVGGDTVLVESAFRTDWPPPDKLPSGQLPAGFSIRGVTQYSNLAFLPRGTRIQYTFRQVELDGAVFYGYRIGKSESPATVASLAYFDDDGDAYPDAPFDAVEPRLFTYSVLPGAYPPGAAGTTLAGRTTTPLLVIDANYLQWGGGANPAIRALRNMGVRADVLRLQDAGLRRGNGIGGHELMGISVIHTSNHFPNSAEWALTDSLAVWYRMIILETGDQVGPVIEDSDAQVLVAWWNRASGNDAGDRGLLSAGDNLATSLLGPSGATANQVAFAQSVLGLASSTPEWSNSTTVPFPSIDDRFAAQVAGPGLAPPGSFRYSIDAGSGALSVADGITAMSGASLSATFPSDGASASRAAELDIVPDHDRNKSIFYSFSTEFARQGGMPLLDLRAQLLYKFLTSCRGPRSSADTAFCWPCPTASNKYGNWLVSGAFLTGTYGPLYPIQDATIALSGVGTEGLPAANTLLQNHPNPFNPDTAIPFVVATGGRVTVRIFDIFGRCIRTLLDKDLAAGPHLAHWSGELDRGGVAASGVYFYRVTYPNGEVSAKRMTILR